MACKCRFTRTDTHISFTTQSVFRFVKRKHDHEVEADKTEVLKTVIEANLAK